MPGPVGDPPAGHVAGADGEVGAAVELGQQVAEDGWVVGQVGIHLHQGLVAPRQADLEALPVGAAEPGLGRVADHLDTLPGSGCWF